MNQENQNSWKKQLNKIIDDEEALLILRATRCSEDLPENQLEATDY